MIHRGHKKLVFGCDRCIEARGPMQRPLTGRINEIRRNFIDLNSKIERRITGKDLHTTIDLFDSIEGIIEEIYHEAYAIQN